MAVPLGDAQRRELEALAARLGPTSRRRVTIATGFADPLDRPDRVGEVCMVIRRDAGTLLVSTKTFYPPGAYRLPTGGIAPHEGIAAALERETHEETGLTTATRRFLAAIDYHAEDGGPPVFHTFAFLLDEIGGTLGSLDPAEEILDFREVSVDDLPALAARLEALDAPSTRIGGSWRDWGRFRAVVHRTVHEILASELPSTER